MRSSVSLLQMLGLGLVVLACAHPPSQQPPAEPTATRISPAPPVKVAKKILLIRSTGPFTLDSSCHEEGSPAAKKWPASFGSQQKKKLRREALHQAEHAFLDEARKAGLDVEVFDRNQALTFLGKEEAEIWVLRWKHLQLQNITPNCHGTDKKGSYWQARITAQLTKDREDGPPFSFTEEATDVPGPRVENGKDLIRLVKRTETPVQLAARIIARHWLALLQD